MKGVIFLTVLIAAFVEAKAKLGTTPCQKQDDCPTEECCIYRGALRNGTCGPAIKENEKCRVNYVMIGGKNLLRCSCQRDLTCKRMQVPDARGRMRWREMCIRDGDVVGTTAPPVEETTTPNEQTPNPPVDETTPPPVDETTAPPEEVTTPPNEQTPVPTAEETNPPDETTEGPVVTNPTEVPPGEPDDQLPDER